MYSCSASESLKGTRSPTTSSCSDGSLKPSRAKWWRGSIPEAPGYDTGIVVQNQQTLGFLCSFCNLKPRFITLYSITALYWYNLSSFSKHILVLWCLKNQFAAFCSLFYLILITQSNAFQRTRLTRLVKSGGAKESWTPDLLIANEKLI